MIRADQGDTVKIHYTGRLQNGTVVHATPEERPLHFILGRSEVIAGIDEAVTGMYQGESKTVTLPPEKGYGLHDSKLVEKIPRNQLPETLDLRIGRQLEITGQKGDKLLVLIAGLDDASVTLDGNHPLAGKEMHFEIRLLEVVKKTPLQSAPDSGAPSIS